MAEPPAEIGKPKEEATPDLEGSKTYVEPEEGFDPLDVLSTAIPPRVKMRDGLSAEIVDQLPLAILVHAGDRLIHGNPEFLRLTGYESAYGPRPCRRAGCALQRHDLEGKTERPGTMMVVRADDALVPVTARLQSIRWEDGTALMLALMPLEKSETSTTAIASLCPKKRGLSA